MSSYDVVVGKTVTVMRVTLPPTEDPDSPGLYYFDGFLEVAATGAGIPDLKVDLVVDGEVVQSFTTVTAGRWGFEFYIEPGATYAVKARFPETAACEASETPTYSITPHMFTVMDVTKPPPARASMGETFTFAGVLKEELSLAVVPGATVNIYVDGVVRTTSTAIDGSWAFDIVVETFPTHVYAVFPGDDIYHLSTTPDYEVIKKIETFVTIEDAPPPDVGIGEPFYVSGYLKEVLPPPPEGPGPRGLLDKTVKLYVDGSMVRAERTGCSIEEEWPGHDPGRWRFAVPAPQTLGAHTVEVRFPGDETREPCSSGVIEFNAIESGVVATIENLYAPTKTEQGEKWGGYFRLCNRGTGAGNVRAVISGDIEGETPIITMNQGDCQTIAFGAGGPAIFTIKTGV